MKCDIIIPVWNQLEFTRDCIDSVIKNTDTPYRLIIIDNASDGPTKDFLQNFKASNKAEVILARNEENLGFVKAVNRGLALSDAPYVCLLNNDTIVTNNWLGIMIAVMESAKDAGIVNPSSNTLGQRPANGESPDSYAARIKEYAGRAVELGAAVGFCMLMRREIVSRIGGFDEIYGMGNFEDTDFSRRAAKEGYRSVRACGAYVFHREKTSFGKRETFEDDFARNREIYEFRWGRPRRVAYIVDSCDDNTMKRLNAEALKLARAGNWIWYVASRRVAIPEHSNILFWEMPRSGFYLRLLFRMLVKKKKFDEIIIDNERLGKVLEHLSFAHKAKVGYY